MANDQIQTPISTDKDAPETLVIQDEIQQGREDAAFGVQLVPYHTHNGVDSPIVDPANFTALRLYPGKVDSSGTSVFLPDGWTSSSLGAGQYQIGHTLGTATFGVVVTVNSTINDRIAFTSAEDATTFQVNITAADGGAGHNETFSFIVTQATV